MFVLIIGIFVHLSVWHHPKEGNFDNHCDTYTKSYFMLLVLRSGQQHVVNSFGLLFWPTSASYFVIFCLLVGDWSDKEKHQKHETLDMIEDMSICAQFTTKNVQKSDNSFNVIL